MNNSIWELEMPSFEKLNDNICVDTLVIGGGIAGIMTAYNLSKEGIKVCLVEKDTLASSKTLRTTATISLLQDFLYQDLIKDLGYKKAKDYYDCLKKSIKEYIKLASKFDFELEKQDSIIYTNDNEETIEAEIKALNSLGEEVEEVFNDSFDIKFKKALKVKTSIIIHPLKLIKNLINYFQIYENTEVIKIKNNFAYTNIIKNNQNLKIKSLNIVVATSYPIKSNLFYAMKMYQNRSYVYVIETDKVYNYNIMDIKENGVYIRKYLKYLIVGMNDCRVGQCKNSFLPLDAFCKEHFPNFKLIKSWFNQDLITFDNLPYIGKRNGTYFITGFNMWGFSNSMIASNIIKDLITEKNNKYTYLFNPNRIIVNKDFFKHIFIVTKSILSFKSPRCKHLKSKLVKNKNDATWDCPCHGSSYNIEGETIYNPSDKNLN